MMGRSTHKNSAHQASFWVFNKSQKNVSLGDLGISIRKGAKVNLLGRGYFFTLEQLKASIQTGSLYKKRDRIVPCNTPGPNDQPKLEICSDPLEYRLKSNVVTPEESYLELPELNLDQKLSDEKYAAELIEEEFSFK